LWSAEHKVLDRELGNSEWIKIPVSNSTRFGMSPPLNRRSSVRAQAEAVARKTAAGVRRAIFELIALPPQARALILGDPYPYGMHRFACHYSTGGNVAIRQRLLLYSDQAGCHDHFPSTENASSTFPGVSPKNA
jgi:hypothetical protein